VSRPIILLLPLLLLLLLLILLFLLFFLFFLLILSFSTPRSVSFFTRPMQPNEAAAQGRIADIPMIIGYNAAG
jgi:hypothetical protein